MNVYLLTKKSGYEVNQRSNHRLSYVQVFTHCMAGDNKWLEYQLFIIAAYCYNFPNWFPSCTITSFPLITGRNEVVAKVMFLQVCVCPQGGRVSASVHAGIPDPPGTRQTPMGPGRHPPRPGRTPRDQADPPGPGRPPRPGSPPWDQADTPQPGWHPPNQADTPSGTRQIPPRPSRPPTGPGRPPLGSRLQHTVYERPVRILLECILVL